jgi:hypothetical protein
MRPRIKDWIPGYGLCRYMRRYFDVESRGYRNREVIVAEMFMWYHIAMCVIIIFAVLTKLNIISL